MKRKVVFITGDVGSAREKRKKLVASDIVSFANELNQFYSRFDHGQNGLVCDNVHTIVSN